MQKDEYHIVESSKALLEQLNGYQFYCVMCCFDHKKPISEYQFNREIAAAEEYQRNNLALIENKLKQYKCYAHHFGH